MRCLPREIRITHIVCVKCMRVGQIGKETVVCDEMTGSERGNRKCSGGFIRIARVGVAQESRKNRVRLTCGSCV